MSVRGNAPIKVGIHMYAKYTNCQILLIYSITILFSKNAPKGFASMCLNISKF